MERAQQSMLHEMKVEVTIGDLWTQGPKNDMLCYVLFLASLAVRAFPASGAGMLMILLARERLLLKLEVDGGYRLVFLKLSHIRIDMCLFH